MFIIRYAKNSFKFSEMIFKTKENLFKVFIYFILLSLISIFPMSLMIILEQGWRIDFVEQAFREKTPTWELPRDSRIELGKYYSSTDEEVIYEHQGVTFIFNYQGGGYDKEEKQIIFAKDEIIYTNSNAEMKGNYGGFDLPYRFNDINLLSNQERYDAFVDFGMRIENSFSPFIVFYSIVTNTLSMMAANILFALLMSVVLQLFRFGYSTFFTYKESLVFITYSMTLPSILSFGVGLFAPGFSTVIYQFGIGIILMVVMLKYGKKRFA